MSAGSGGEAPLTNGGDGQDGGVIGGNRIAFMRLFLARFTADGAAVGMAQVSTRRPKQVQVHLNTDEMKVLIVCVPFLQLVLLRVPSRADAAAELSIIIAAIQQSIRQELFDDCRIQAVSLPKRWPINSVDVGAGPCRCYQVLLTTLPALMD